MINVTLLGSGGGMPMPDRFLSSMVIGYESRKIIVDCGEGTQVAMRKNKSGFKTLDIICLTHCHGDHIYGLPGLLSTIGNSERTDPITIVGPGGIKKIVEGMRVGIPFLPYDVKVMELDLSGDCLHIHLTPKGLIIEESPLGSHKKAEMTISTLPLYHSSPCLGYSFYMHRNPRFYKEKAIEHDIPIEYWKRLQNGEPIDNGVRVYEPSLVLGEKRRGIKLSYITDTRPIDSIPRFINDSDLFVCEGTYGDENDMDKAIQNRHMTFAEAAELAYRGNVKQLWLTHFSPSMDKPELYIENTRIIFKRTILGQDGLTTTINYPSREFQKFH